MMKRRYGIALVLMCLMMAGSGYGDAQSSFRKLLNLSDGPEDPTQLDPWWSVYCAAGVSGCD